MTNLPAQQPPFGAKTASFALSSGLKSLLNLGERANSIEELIRSPALLAEAREVLPALSEAASRAAGPAGVRRVIAKSLVLFRIDMSDAEWPVWWATYTDLLSDIPEPALEEGMRAYMLTPDAEFMPKPGKLRELALTVPNRAVEAYQRAAHAIRRADEKLFHETHKFVPGEMPQPRPMPSEAEKAAVFRMRDEYRRQKAALDASKPQPPPLPPIHGKADETGITPELRRALGR